MRVPKSPPVLPNVIARRDGFCPDVAISGAWEPFRFPSVIARSEATWQSPITGSSMDGNEETQKERLPRLLRKLVITGRGNTRIGYRRLPHTLWVPAMTRKGQNGGSQ